MAKLLVVSQIPPPVHGSTVMTKVFLEEVSKLGHDLAFVNKDFSATVADVGQPSPSKLLKVAPLVWRTVRAALSRPRLAVIFLTNRPGSFCVDFALIVILRAFRVPVVAYIHTVGFKRLAQKGSLFKALVRFAFRCVSRTVILSSQLQHDVEPFAGADTVSVVPNTIERRDCDLRPRNTGLRPLIIFVSNLLPDKGAHLFLEAAIPLVRSHGWRIEVYGAPADSGYMYRLGHMINAAGLQKFIAIKGPLAREQKWRVFSEADLLVFPSVYAYEAQPLVLIEALAAGLPAVAFDVGAVGDMVRDGETGTLVPRDDVRLLRRAIEAFFTDPSRSGQLSSSCRELFASRFSRSAFSSNWQKIIEEALG